MRCTHNSWSPPASRVWRTRQLVGGAVSSRGSGGGVLSLQGCSLGGSMSQLGLRGDTQPAR